jgi:hypothetical protein
MAEIKFIDYELNYKFKYAFINLTDSDGGGILKNLMDKDDDTPPENTDKPPEKTDEEKNDEIQENNSEPDKEPENIPVNCENDDDSPVPEETVSYNISDNTTDNDENNDSAENENSKPEKNNKKTLGSKVDMLMKIWNCAKHPIRRIMKGFHISNIYIDFVVSGEDAYKCAINYGRLCTAVYNVLAAFAGLFTVKYKTVDVECGFDKKEQKWDASCTLYFLPVTVVFSGLWFLITYIFRIYIPNKQNKNVR